MRLNHSHANPTRALSRAVSVVRGGSALVLVIGALAMISVFAAIYLAIGRSDRQNAAALKQRASIDEYSDVFASYIANVIGNDRLDVYPILSFNNRSPLREYSREVVDYPYTDWTVRSQPDRPEQQFSAPGRHVVYTGNPGDVRVPYDPWLASTEAEYLGSENIYARGATGARFYSGTFESNGSLRNQRRFLDNRDWRQISNLAPDGRFVNLWNLRSGKDFKTDTYGGFDAEPGFGTYNVKVNGATRVRRTMSYGLSLLQRQGANAQGGGGTNFLQAFDPTESGLAWVQGYDAPQPVARVMGVDNAELANVPAVWTMNQRYLFSPANQPFITYERQSRQRGNETGIANWESPDFMPYQYADADGDGMYDSRWIELIDASEAGAFKNLLPYSLDDTRLFAAIRVEDLSARVNVNASGDATIAPTREYPIGLTPAEIDLRRLLTMEDFAFDYGIDYSELDALPAGSDLVQNYQEYDYQLKRNLRNRLQAFRGDNAKITNVLGEGVPRVSVAEEVGRLAYDAIRLAIETADSPGDRFVGPRYSQIGTPNFELASAYDLIGDSRFHYSLKEEGGIANAGKWFIDPFKTAAQRRAEYYDQLGGNLPKTSRDKLSPLSNDIRGEVFGLDDLAELLTFKGINDPDITSRLELTTTGKADLDPALLNNPSLDDLRRVSRRFDPLISNRPLEIDRFGHADGRRAEIPVDSLFQTGLGPRVIGTMDPEAMVLLNISPRARLTTYSGATPLPTGSPVEIDPLTLRVPDLQVEKLAQSLKNLTGSNQIAFNVYAGSLVPDSEIENYDSWKPELKQYLPTDGAFRPTPLDTLSYGYRGPELALRLSAHLAVNFNDMLDEDEVPSAATLLIDQTARDQELKPGGRTTYPSREQAEKPFPWIYNETNGKSVRDDGVLRGELQIGLDRGLDKLPSGVIDPTRPGGQFRRAVNVFGVEPQPVLTEVAVLNVFTDAPWVQGGTLGDKDFNGEGKFREAQGVLISLNDEPKQPGNPINFVTLDTDVPDSWGTNPDFLMQALVFQVHNPYPETITFLGEGPAGDTGHSAQIQFSHYLEYEGRFFRMGSYRESVPDEDATEPQAKILADPRERYGSVTLKPGETAVFYALMDEADPNSTSTFDWSRIEAHVDRILKASGLSQNAYGYQASSGASQVGDDQNQFTGVMQEWFEYNLKDDLNVGDNGDGVKVYRVREFSPASGDYVQPGYKKLSVPNAAATIQDRNSAGVVRVADRKATAPVDRSVRLWRVMRNNFEDGNAGRVNRENVLANDFLCDRLKVGETLEREFNVGAIRRTVSLDPSEVDPFRGEGYTVAGYRFERNDNTGWTVAQWAGVRRKGRETSEFVKGSGAGAELILGAVSPAMIATEEVADELDESNGLSRGLLFRWSEGPVPPPVNRLEDLAQDAGSFQMIDMPNFKYRLVDLLRMKNPGIDTATSLTREPFFSSENTAGLVTDTAEGPVLPGMALQPYNKASSAALSKPGGLEKLSQQANYYKDSRTALFDTEMEKPIVTALDANGSVDDKRYDLNYTDDKINPDSERLYRVNPDVSFGLEGYNDELRHTVRPTDLLTPFAVGPVQVPEFESPGGAAKDRTNASQQYNPDAEWITFPEMLAIALGYKDVRPDDTNQTITQLYGLLWIEETPNNWVSVLDSGKLRLDKYTRYFDMDVAKSVTDPNDVRFPGNFTPGVDRRRGSGVPTALELLGSVRGVGQDMRSKGFRAGVPGSQGAGEDQTPKYSYNERFDPRSDVVVGRININTAPESVLRLLPGLTPSVEYFDATRADGFTTPVAASANDWTLGYKAGGVTFSSTDTDGVTYTEFGTPSQDALVTDNVLDSVRDTPDRAALLLAYRDRKRAWPRLMSDPVTVTTKGTNTDNFKLGADFTPFTSDSPSPWRRLAQYENDPNRTAILTGVELQINNYVPDRTRSILTGIPGLRETPGFSTPGEVLAVTLRLDDAPETPDPSKNPNIPLEGRPATAPDVGKPDSVFDFNRHNLLSGMGYDGNSLKAGMPYYISGADIKNVASYDTAIYSDPTSGGRNDSVVDEADERIAIAGAIMNSIDVRSDTFAVWFVLQGYRPEDVTDLRPNDPLVPSFQRRFLMVIDRSNVVTESDTPKIVLFKEVPM